MTAKPGKRGQMNNNTLNENLNTAYDDAYHTLLNDCPRLIIPVVNEVFHENYDLNEEVKRSNEKYFINQQNGEQLIRIADSNFGIRTSQYHFECQSTADGTIIVRIFEYDTQAALQGAKLKKNILEVEFPNTALLYLRHSTNTPSSMIIRVRVPGDSCSYEVPVMKAQLYSIDEIFAKKLFFLIPFHIFMYEKEFHNYDTDEEKRGELKAVYEDILNRLNNSVKERIITEYEKKTVITMTQKVLQKIAMKYSNVKESVGSVMGGKVLEYEAKDILNQGKALGKAEGKAEAILMLLQEIGVIPESLRARIADEKNLETLNKWLKSVARAETVEEFENNM